MVKAKSRFGDGQELLTRIREARIRLIRVIVVLALACAAGLALAPWLLRIVTAGAGELIYLAPAEAFMVHLRLAVAFGLLIAIPFAIANVILFAGRGLPWRRRLSLWSVVLLGLVFFAGGIMFAYLVVLPSVLTFLLSFASDKVQPLLALEGYVAFVFGLVVPFGLVFQLPLSMAALARLGIVSPQMLRAFRRYAIVAIFALSAILTPPDVVSQLLMAGPMLVLYEIGALLARVAWRARR